MKINFRVRCILKGLPRGYTLGPHQKFLGCGKALFYGAFSKPFLAERESAKK
jgi:hypothetical protein